MLNVKLLYDSAIPLLGIYPRELKIGVQTKNLYTNVHISIIHNNKKQAACSSTEEYNLKDVVKKKNGSEEPRCRTGIKMQT